MSGSRWISSFLEAFHAERDAAQNTLESYRRDLLDFADHAEIRTATPEVIRQYLLHLEAQGLAASTRARRLSSIRQLYAFAFQEGLRADNPAARIAGPKRQKTLPNTLSEAEVEALLSAASQIGKTTALKRRNACMFHLLYATGMRVSELVSLPVLATSGNPEMILVRGKGGRERMVPLSPPARMVLSAWLPEREALLADKGHVSKFLFPNKKGQSHFSRVQFFTLVKQVAQRAGLEAKTVSPHTLRHAFATHLLSNGADLRAIQMLLGHADIATTEIYTHVLDERLKALVLEKHPLEKSGFSL